MYKYTHLGKCLAGMSPLLTSRCPHSCPSTGGEYNNASWWRQNSLMAAVYRHGASCSVKYNPTFRCRGHKVANPHLYSWQPIIGLLPTIPVDGVCRAAMIKVVQSILSSFPVCLSIQLPSRKRRESSRHIRTRMYFSRITFRCASDQVRISLQIEGIPPREFQIRRFCLVCLHTTKGAPDPDARYNLDLILKTVL